MTKLKYCAYDNKNFAFVNIANNFKNLYGRQTYARYKIFNRRYVAT